MIYPENITEQISIEEVSLFKGELYTIKTNKNNRCQNKKSVVAIINGTDAKTIEKALQRIPQVQRNKVKEITIDMAPNMALAARNSFINSNAVIDRFHVVRLVSDALQHIRTSFRWQGRGTSLFTIFGLRDGGENWKCACDCGLAKKKVESFIQTST